MMGMKAWNKIIFGVVSGFLIFVWLIPAAMFYFSDHKEASPLQWGVFVLFTIVGVGLSLWSVIYMKKVGEGTPMDIMNLEIGPRTKKLLTEGPYRFCRNPMLLGILIFYIGIQVRLLSLKPFIIFVLFIIAMYFQLKKEEARLEADFGEEYLEYKKRTGMFFPKF